MIKYTKKMAEKAVRRLMQRSVEERLEFLRTLIFEVVDDKEPTFKGVEPNGTSYAGPPVWEWLAHTIGYAAFNRVPIKRLVDKLYEGHSTASEHDWSSKQFWAEQDRLRASRVNGIQQ